MTEGEAEKYVASLNKTLLTLKKNPNRRFLRKTLVGKLNTSKQDYNHLLGVIENLPEKHQHFFLKAAREIYAEIRTYINSRIETAKHLTFKTVSIIIIKLIKTYKNILLTQKRRRMDIIKVITSLVPVYNGSNENLKSFLDALAVVTTLATPENTNLIIATILTKLQGKARNAFPQNPSTIDEIKVRITQIVTPTPPSTIIAKMALSRQRNNINDFVKEIESLKDALENAYIAKHYTTETAQEAATEQAIKYLIAGLKNEKTKIIISAGNYTTLTAAINKVLEDTSNEDTRVLQVRANTHQNRNNTQRYQQNFGNSQNNNYNGNFQNRNNGYQNNNNHCNNFNQNRNNNGYNNNFNRNNFNNQNFNRNNNNSYNQNRNNNQNNNRNNHQNNNGYNNNPNNGYNNNNNHTNNNGNNQRNNQQRRNVYTAENTQEPPARPQADVDNEEGEQLTHPRR